MQIDYQATAERLVQLYPRESFTFPHLGMKDHRIALLVELLKLHHKTKTQIHEK